MYTVKETKNPKKLYFKITSDLNFRSPKEKLVNFSLKKSDSALSGIITYIEQHWGEQD